MPGDFEIVFGLTIILKYNKKSNILMQDNKVNMIKHHVSKPFSQDQS